MLLLTGGVASAEPIRPGGTRWSGVDFLYGTINTSSERLDLFGLTLEGGMHTDTRFGYVLRLPILHSRGDFAPTVLGNLTAGTNAVILRHDGSFITRWWLTGDVSFPTAGSSGQGLTTSSAHAVLWIPDPGLYAPDTWTFRGGTHLTLDNRRWRAGISVDTQFLIGDDNTDVRVVGAVDGEVSLWRALGAYASVITSVELSANNGDEDMLTATQVGVIIHTAELSRLRLYAYVPVDSSYRNELEARGLVMSFTTTF